jgi:hypothetical protein
MARHHQRFLPHLASPHLASPHPALPPSLPAPPLAAPAPHPRVDQAQRQLRAQQPKAVQSTDGRPRLGLGLKLQLSRPARQVRLPAQGANQKRWVRGVRSVVTCATYRLWSVVTCTYTCTHKRCGHGRVLKDCSPADPCGRELEEQGPRGSHRNRVAVHRCCKLPTANWCGRGSLSVKPSPSKTWTSPES